MKLLLQAGSAGNKRSLEICDMEEDAPQQKIQKSKAKPTSDLNLRNALIFCREWLVSCHANVESVVKPLDIVAFSLDFLGESPDSDLVERIRSTNDPREKLNFLVDVFRLGA